MLDKEIFIQNNQHLTQQEINHIDKVFDGYTSSPNFIVLQLINNKIEPLNISVQTIEHNSILDIKWDLNNYTILYSIEKRNNKIITRMAVIPIEIILLNFQQQRKIKQRELKINKILLSL
jgi:hypothetical protein